MAGKLRRAFGSSWLDTLLPLAIGLLCALIVVREGGPLWALLVVPVLCWCFWHVARWLEGRLVVRVLFVTALATMILLYVLLFFGVDTAKLCQAVADAGIRVNTVSSERNAIVVSIQPASWGPERNTALRAIFSAAHTHAKSKKSVRIQWGDAITTTVKMMDIEAFLAGKITYKEILNRMDWTGTPDVLPDDSTTSHRPWLMSKPPGLRFSDGQI